MHAVKSIQAERIRRLRALEQGGDAKAWGTAWPIALCYANTYFVGMSSLGFQTLHAQLNECPGVLGERVFWDYHDPEASAGRFRRPSRDPAADAGDDDAAPAGWPSEMPLSVESGRALNEFPIIAFSIAFEMDYLHLVDMLMRAGIEPWAARRGPDAPLVVAGGSAITMNRLPIYDFVDVVIHGDGEEAVERLAEALVAVGPGRGRLREALRGAPGFEVTDPRDPEEELGSTDDRPNVAAGRLSLAPRIGEFETRTRLFTEQTEFSNRGLIEISRGCPYKCTFCIMGYQPYKYERRTPEAIERTALAMRPFTNRVGLVASAVGVHKEIEDVCARLMHHEFDVSFSSLRVEDVKPAMVEALLRSGQRTLTIAPEAGNEQFRIRMRKRLTDARITEFVSDTVAKGMQNIKLYYMVGLPGESDDDVVSIARFTEELHRVQVAASRSHGRMGHLALNVGVFVPKPGTPLREGGFAGVAEGRRRLKLLQRELARTRNLKVHFSNPQMAAAQTILSCGTRRASRIIMWVWEHSRGDWRPALKEFAEYLEEVGAPAPADQLPPTL